MVIALPYDKETEEIYPATGSCEWVYLATIDEKTKKVVKEEVVSTLGNTHRRLPSYLAKKDVSVFLCSHIGGPLLSLREEENRKVYLTNTRDVFQSISLFLSGNLIEATPSLSQGCGCGCGHC